MSAWVHPKSISLDVQKCKCIFRQIRWGRLLSIHRNTNLIVGTYIITLPRKGVFTAENILRMIWQQVHSAPNFRNILISGFSERLLCESSARTEEKQTFGRPHISFSTLKLHSTSTLKRPHHLYWYYVKFFRVVLLFDFVFIFGRFGLGCVTLV